MFGGKKEKALQDELYTIKKQIADTVMIKRRFCADDSIPCPDGRKYRNS